jgi:hypothetical protein
VHVFVKNDSPHNNILIFIYSSDGDDGLINIFGPTVSFITLTVGNGGPGYRSRHSDLLRAGRSGDRITVWPTQTLNKWYRVSCPGVERPGHGVGGEAKERVWLYF